MYGNRKLRRSSLNCYFFISLPVLNFEFKKERHTVQNEKIRNVSVNPKCLKRRNADRGH